MSAIALDMPGHCVDALEPGATARSGVVVAPIGQAIQFDTRGLESYFFANWNPVLVDLLVVAAVAELCDVAHRRPQHSWSRRFDVRVAVHDPALWSRPDVCGALEDALSFLTGDVWRFGFVERVR